MAQEKKNASQKGDYDDFCWDNAQTVQTERKIMRIALFRMHFFFFCSARWAVRFILYLLRLELSECIVVFFLCVWCVFSSYFILELIGSTRCRRQNIEAYEKKNIYIFQIWNSYQPLIAGNSVKDSKQTERNKKAEIRSYNFVVVAFALLGIAF